jgi:hypothetical protein
LLESFHGEGVLAAKNHPHKRGLGSAPEDIIVRQTGLEGAMSKALLRDTLGWGLVLWLFGYLFSFALFFFVPLALLGWVVTPFALALTLWVLFKKVKGPTFGHYAAVAVVWTALAVTLDYFCIVKLLHPADGYYKADVYLYYALTFLLPLAVGWKKTR